MNDGGWEMGRSDGGRRVRDESMEDLAAYRSYGLVGRAADRLAIEIDRSTCYGNIAKTSRGYSATSRRRMSDTRRM